MRAITLLVLFAAAALAETASSPFWAQVDLRGGVALPNEQRLDLTKFDSEVTRYEALKDLLIKLDHITKATVDIAVGPYDVPPSVQMRVDRTTGAISYRFNTYADDGIRVGYGNLLEVSKDGAILRLRVDIINKAPGLQVERGELQKLLFAQARKQGLRDRFEAFYVDVEKCLPMYTFGHDIGPVPEWRCNTVTGIGMGAGGAGVIGWERDVWFYEQIESSYPGL